MDELYEDLRKTEAESPTTSQLKSQEKPDTTYETRTSFSLKKILLPPAIIISAIVVIFILIWIFGKKDPAPAEDEFTKDAVVLEGNLTPLEILSQVDPFKFEKAGKK